MNHQPYKVKKILDKKDDFKWVSDLFICVSRFESLANDDKKNGTTRFSLTKEKFTEDVLAASLKSIADHMRGTIPQEDHFRVLQSRLSYWDSVHKGRL